MTHTIIRALVLAAAAACLTGCASLKGTFENRITRTLSGDRVFVTSLYGWIGITAELSAEDAAELHRMAEAARMAEQMALILRMQSAQQKGTNQ